MIEKISTSRNYIRDKFNFNYFQERQSIYSILFFWFFVCLESSYSNLVNIMNKSWTKLNIKCRQSLVSYRTSWSLHPTEFLLFYPEFHLGFLGIPSLWCCPWNPVWANICNVSEYFPKEQTTYFADFFS